MDEPHRRPAAAFRAVIFDVDGVLVASPHERAWREALAELMATEWRDTPGRYAGEAFTTRVYLQHVAGKARLAGARAALGYFDVPDLERRTMTYATRKQRRLEALIDAGEFVAFDDALRLVLAARARGLRLAVASSSKNAGRFMERIPLDLAAAALERSAPAPPPAARLNDAFEANVCGEDLPQGKPHPEIFLMAARKLGVPPETCVVVEDAASGVQAAKAGGMAALAVARLDDEALLAAAGADLVVTSCDEVDVDALLRGRLQRRCGRPHR
jgi:beta-phosphoglucomutase-like phosphatase (HAD superfamily)